MGNVGEHKHCSTQKARNDIAHNFAAEYCPKKHPMYVEERIDKMI